MLPERFGRYEVLEEIGDGAMGRVYRARDPVVGRTVAVKTVKSEYLTREQAPEYLKRFRREAQAAGKLNHPQIVSIFDVGEDYLVMEYLEGKTLQALLKEKGRLEPAEALRILAPIAEAVDHAHRQGVVHRDIKPGNIMVQASGPPKLMDFGVAHVEASLMTTTGQVLGSPSYMAPEQVAGTETTGRTDVYALGVVAYEAVTGQKPFQGSNITTIIFRIMSEPAPPPRTLNPALPTRYDDVFQRALAKDPAQRFPTAGALVAALEIREFEESLAAAVAPAQAAAPSRRRSTRWWPVLAAAALVGIIALAQSRRGPTVSRHDDPTLPASPPATPEPAPTAAQPTPLAIQASPPGTAPRKTAPPTTAAAAPRTPRHPSPAGVPAPVAAPKAAPTATPTPPALSEGTLVDIGPGVTPPRRIRGEPPPYPESARRLQQEGTVTVALVVNANGEPSDLRVVKSAGKILDEAVLAAVRSWKFEPARKDGIKVAVRWQVRQSFEIAR
jgi:serine/threonine-protein kinase